MHMHWVQPHTRVCAELTRGLDTHTANQPGPRAKVELHGFVCKSCGAVNLREAGKIRPVAARLVLTDHIDRANGAM